MFTLREASCHVRCLTSFRSPCPGEAQTSYVEMTCVERDAWSVPLSQSWTIHSSWGSRHCTSESNHLCRTPFEFLTYKTVKYKSNNCCYKVLSFRVVCYTVANWSPCKVSDLPDPFHGFYNMGFQARFFQLGFHSPGVLVHLVLL